jgi:hypothetical protein
MYQGSKYRHREINTTERYSGIGTLNLNFTLCLAEATGDLFLLLS